MKRASAPKAAAPPTVRKSAKPAAAASPKPLRSKPPSPGRRKAPSPKTARAKKSASSPKGASCSPVGSITPLTGVVATPEIAMPAVASSVGAAFCHAWQHVVVKSRMAAHPAVVLDIDDTALIGPDDLQRTHSPVHGFYRKLLDAGVAVFFVTARSEADPHNRENTVKQLRECGYPKFTELLMAPRYTSRFSTIKRSHRLTIAKLGYEVLVNAGDQWADLVSEDVPEKVLADLQKKSHGKPLVFYNTKEVFTLCIKLWSSAAS